LNRKVGLTQSAIDQIASDNTSGAAEILRRAADVFSLLSAQQTKRLSIDIDQAQQWVTETCVELVLAQPDMTPLLRLASAGLTAARNTTGPLQILKSAEEAALRFIELAEAAASAAASHAAHLIGRGATVLTHSRSSTVLAALIEARRQSKAFSVIATESRPMLEGRALAETLAVEGVRASLIADAAAALVLDQVDLILVGADRITPEYLLNKIGTRMIALAAKERTLPMYAVCDTSKFIDADYLNRTVRNERSAEELWQDAPEGVIVVNRYFEPTPLELFTAIITENGELSTHETSRRAERASIDRELIDALARYRSQC
jgi:translation initiation factor eIF-2B subunit delta